MPSKCHGRLSRNIGDCLRTPTVTRNGKGYCWQHDPERLAAEHAAERQRRHDREEQLDAEHSTKLLRARLMRESGVDSLGNDDLQTIIDLGGIRRILNDLTE